MSQITLLSLNYCNQLQESYHKLCDLPGFVLLESSDKGRGRYDILSALPYERIKLTENTPDKLNELKKFTQSLSTETSNIDLPFQGGAMGYISYDLGPHLLDIFSTPQPELSTLPLLDMGLYDWGIIVDHHLKKVTLIAANRHPSTSDIVQEVLFLWNQSVIKPKEFIIKSDFQPLISKNNYEESFNAIHRALEEGRSYQVNFTQPFHAAYYGDSWQMYEKVLSKNPVPFSAFMRTDDADILSFSPERFLLYEQGKLLTSPIKGTIERSNNPVADEQLKRKLNTCSKNRAENVMIVDLLRNDFGKIAKPKTVQVTNLCTIESFDAVHHLVSDIEAECLDSIQPFEVFMSCFPGGSITGAPKLESMRIINEQERYSRGVYCGSIGYFSHHGRFDMNIAIRTVTAKNSILHLAAGGGIVIDSNCNDEYTECYIKIAAIINGLR